LPKWVEGELVKPFYSQKPLNTLLIKFYAVQDRGLGGVPPQTPVSKSAEDLVYSVLKVIPCLSCQRQMNRQTGALKPLAWQSAICSNLAIHFIDSHL
jgi:hypothetical protein